MELNLLFPEKTQLFTEDITKGFTTKKSLMKYALLPLGKSNGQKYEDSQTNLIFRCCIPDYHVIRSKGIVGILTSERVHQKIQAKPRE